MTCDAVRDRLLEAAPEEVQDHLQRCEACGRLSQAIAAAEADLHRAMDAYEDRSFDEAWHAAAARRDPEPQRRRIMSSRMFHGLVALAAGALVSVTAASRLAPDSWVDDWVPASWVGTPDEGAWEEVEALLTSAELPELLAAWDELQALDPDELQRHRSDLFRLAVRIGVLSERLEERTPPAWVERDGVAHNAFFLEASALDRASGGRLLGQLPDGLGDRIAAEEQLAPIRALVEDVAAQPWNALGVAEWGEHARALYDALPATEPDPGLRFRLLVQLGRAAENANDPVAPFYDEVGGKRVNVGWYLAGDVARTRPELLEALDEGLARNVAYYAGAIERGDLQAP